MWVLPALAKLATASALAAAAMALLALAGSGALGNFGQVGIEQLTFGPAVFLWFLVVGGATVVMAGGLTRRPPQPVSAEQPVPAADDEAPEVVTEAVTAPVAVATADSDEPSEDVAAAEVIEDGDPTPDADVPAAADPMPEPEPDEIPAEFPVGPREPVDLDYLAGLPDAEDMFDADGDLGPGDTPPSGRPDTH